MRNAFLSLTALALAACSSAPAYRASAVPVAPAYRVVPHEAAPDERPSMSPSPGDSAAAVASVHYLAASPDTPFWRALGDPALAALIADALRSSPSTQGAA